MEIHTDSISCISSKRTGPKLFLFGLLPQFEGDNCAYNIQGGCDGALDTKSKRDSKEVVGEDHGLRNCDHIQVKFHVYRLERAGTSKVGFVAYKVLKLLSTNSF